MAKPIKGDDLFYRKRKKMNNKENEDKAKETDITINTQKRIFASLLFSKEAPDDIQDVRPEYFDSIAVRTLVKLFLDFRRDYSSVEMGTKAFSDAFNQRVSTFIGDKKDNKLPISKEELLDVYEEILLLKGEDFLPAQGSFRKLARKQSHHRALDKIIEGKLIEEENYDDIHKLMTEAYATGSRDGGLIKLSDIEAKDVEWLWENHIPLGEITILVGDPGVGKSYFSYFLAAQISRGGSWPDNPDKPIEDGKILILSTDEDPNYAIRPRSDAAGADIDKITVLEGSRGEKGEIKILNLTKDIYRMEEIFKKDKGFRLWIIDTLTDYLGRMDSHKYTDVRWALMPLLALARKYHVAVVGIMHCNKNTSLQVLYRIMGSMGFAAVARSIWVIAKDREDEEQKRRFFAPLKANLAPEQKPLVFHLENLGKVAKVVFEDEPVADDFDIEQVLAPGEKAVETIKAKKFILEVLKDGAVLTEEIKSAARDEGISWGTLRKARGQMHGVKARKENKPRGKWFWELDEFTQKKALMEADSKVRTEATRKEHQTEEADEEEGETK